MSVSKKLLISSLPLHFVIVRLGGGHDVVSRGIKSATRALKYIKITKLLRLLKLLRLSRILRAVSVYEEVSVCQ